MITIQSNELIGFGVVFLMLLAVLILLVLLFRRISYAVVDTLELTYAHFTKRPFFIHFYLIKRRLKTDQVRILKQNFTFYNRLDYKHQSYFRHRLATFIKEKEFKGKLDFEITDEVKVLIGATAVMLTFGFRNYIIKSLKYVVVYPTQYFSEINKVYHKGEFNPRLKVLVLSWDNFLKGYEIQNDNINLGIHEFAHAIHHNSIFQNDINSILFVDTFNGIRRLLQSDMHLRQALIDSEYFRDYAFTNDMELLAVIIETFIETPREFRSHFPEIYKQVKQMLNFSFAGY